MKIRFNVLMMAASTVLYLSPGFAANAVSPEATLAERGTVSKFLMNPEGDVDGFILSTGTQVHFPPHMSNALTTTIALKDKVKVEGFRENAKVFKAETITNIKTNKSVTDVPPDAGPRELGTNPPPLPNAPGPRDRLTMLKADGKIQYQLYGPRGDVNGVLLSSGEIVHFGPRILDDSGVKTDVGQKLRASGYGTKNEFGESFEATELSNN